MSKKYSHFSAFSKLSSFARELDDSSESRDSAILHQHRRAPSRSKRTRYLHRIFSFKELFDRLGYGFAPQQFISILFFLIGATPFLVGIIFAFKHVLSSLISFFMQFYVKVKSIHSKNISLAGMIFAFSLIGLILATRFQDTLLFSLFLLTGSVGIVTYGELYGPLVQRHIRQERKNFFLDKILSYGLFITGFAFILSGLLFDFFGFHSSITLFGFVFPLSGYFISFEVAALFFFISGFFIQYLPLQRKNSFSSTYFHSIKKQFFSFWYQTKYFFTHSYLFFLFLGSILLVVIEILGSAYYGYLIFTHLTSFQFTWIALFFTSAIFVSFLLQRYLLSLKKHLDIRPLFVLGTLLMAFLPFILHFNPHFHTLWLGVIFYLSGLSTLSMAQSIFIKKILPFEQRKLFFKTVDFLLLLPTIIFVPLGAYLTFIHGFDFFLQLVLGILIFGVLPIYFILVLLSDRKKYKR